MSQMTPGFGNELILDEVLRDSMKRGRCSDGAFHEEDNFKVRRKTMKLLKAKFNFENMELGQHQYAENKRELLFFWHQIRMHS